MHPCHFRECQVGDHLKTAPIAATVGKRCRRQCCRHCNVCRCALKGCFHVAFSAGLFIALCRAQPATLGGTNELPLEVYAQKSREWEAYWDNRWDVGAAHGGTPGSKLQYVYVQQVRKALGVRREKVAALGLDEDAWRARRAEIKRVLVSDVFFPLQRLLDEGPRGAVGFKPRVVAEHVDVRGFEVRMLTIETRPGNPVPLALWGPTSQQSMPRLVVLAPGHHPHGLRDETYQQLAMNLVLQLGLAVLAFDPMCQGERWQFVGRKFSHGECGFIYETCNATAHACTRAHDSIGQHLQLLNQSLAAYFIYDCIRILDFAETLNGIVDVSSLAMLGTSGGGMLTAYVGAIDERVKVSVLGSWFGTWRQLRSTNCYHDAEQIWWRGITPLGLEKVDLLIARAPRPTLMTFGSRDGCLPLWDAVPAYEEAKQAYIALRGHGRQLVLSQTVGDHGWHSEQLDGVYEFLIMHLGLPAQALTHKPYAILDCKQLSVDGPGQKAPESHIRDTGLMPDVVADQWRIARTTLLQKRAAWAGIGDSGRAARSELANRIRDVIGFKAPPPNEVPNYTCAACADAPPIGDTWMPPGKGIHRVALLMGYVGVCTTLLRVYHGKSVPTRIIVVVGGSSDVHEAPTEVERKLVVAGLSVGYVVALIGLCGFGGGYHAPILSYIPFLLGRSHAALMVHELLLALRLIAELHRPVGPVPTTLFSFGDTALLLAAEKDLVEAVDHVIVWDSLVGWEVVGLAWERGSGADLSELLPIQMLVHGVGAEFDVPDVLAVLVGRGIVVDVVAPRVHSGQYPWRQSPGVLERFYSVAIAAATPFGSFGLIDDATEDDAVKFAIGR